MNHTVEVVVALLFPACCIIKAECTRCAIDKLLSDGYSLQYRTNLSSRAINRQIRAACSAGLLPLIGVLIGNGWYREESSVDKCVDWVRLWCACAEKSFLQSATTRLLRLPQRRRRSSSGSTRMYRRSRLRRRSGRRAARPCWGCRPCCSTGLTPLLTDCSSLS